MDEDATKFAVCKPDRNRNTSPWDVDGPLSSATPRVASNPAASGAEGFAVVQRPPAQDTCPWEAGPSSARAPMQCGQEPAHDLIDAARSLKAASQANKAKSQGSASPVLDP